MSGYSIEIREEAGKKQVKCLIRKKWLVLTPEEEVRQNCLLYLLNELKYPKSMIASEHGIHLNGMSKRCDIVVFSKSGAPKMIIECKAASVPITQKTLEQIGRYNLVLQVPFLYVTNGIQHFAYEVNLSEQRFKSLNVLPEYNALNTKNPFKA